MPSHRGQYQYRVTLDQRTGEAVERLARLSKTNPGKIIGEWIGEATIPLEQVADTLEAALNVPEQVRGDFVRGFAKAADRTRGLQTDLFRLIEDMGEPLASPASEQGPGAPVGATPDPRPSNTGVTKREKPAKTTKPGGG